ncbi:hypothetical protein LCGC14_3119300, partial [marine sediment metagenome]
STHTGIGLSGALDANSQAITNHAQAITDNAILTVDGSPNDDEFARFTANGLEGLTVAETLAAISPLTTRGDIMFRNATVSTRLAKGNNGDVLTMGANDPAWAAAGGGTLGFFVPVNYTDATMNFDGIWPVAQLSTSGHRAFTSFYIPSDFSSITEAVIIVIPKFTQASNNWDIQCYYASAGQASNTHVENDTAATYNTVANQLFEVDISGILTSLVAGDYASAKITLSDSGHDLNVIGVRFKYS